MLDKFWGIYVVVIPGDITSQLQQLDICINEPFKHQLKQAYTD